MASLLSGIIAVTYRLISAPPPVCANKKPDRTFIHSVGLTFRKVESTENRQCNGALNCANSQDLVCSHPFLDCCNVNLLDLALMHLYFADEAPETNLLSAVSELLQNGGGSVLVR